jgi:hypothetical protein
MPHLWPLFDVRSGLALLADAILSIDCYLKPCDGFSRFGSGGLLCIMVAIFCGSVSVYDCLCMTDAP